MRWCDTCQRWYGPDDFDGSCWASEEQDLDDWSQDHIDALILEYEDGLLLDAWIESPPCSDRDWFTPSPN